MSAEEYTDQWLDEHCGDMLNDLARLIAIPSQRGEASEGAPFGPGPAAALKEAVAICRELGLRPNVYGDCIATADINEKVSGLDIICHLDVVGTGEGWDSDPYTMVIKDGCVFGRGTADDKGPAIASLYALKAVAESGAPLRAGARVILGTNEESGMQDLPFFYDNPDVRPAPCTISPDTHFPVVNVEKGHYLMSVSRSWGVTDALPRVVSASSGDTFNVIPADAGAVVAGISPGELQTLCAPAADTLGVMISCSEARNGAQISVKGVSSHAAYPEGSRNALTALLGILSDLPLADCDSTDAIRRLSGIFPFGDSRGKALGIAQEDDISGPLTLSFTILRLDESGVRCTLDGRVPICATEDNCCRIAEERLGAAGFTVEGHIEPAHHTPADSEFVQALLRCYEAVTGKEGFCQSMGGGTYVHNVEGGVAFGAAMPGYDTMMHSANEHMPIGDLLAAAKIYARSILAICS